MLENFFSIDFLLNQFYLPLYLLTWIISLLRYKRFFDTAIKYLPILIIYTFFTELLGYFIKYNDEFQFFSDGRYAWHNVIIYNIYQVVFFIFFFEVYRKLVKNPAIKKQIHYLSIFCFLTYVINAIALNPLHNQMTYAHIIGSVIMLYILGIYFREKYLEETLYPLKFNLMFWVSLGLTVFYTFFPLISIISILNLNIEIQIYFRPILLTSIALMYSLIIIGLLAGKRKAFR